MVKFLYALAVVLIIAGLLFQYAALETFNFFVPKDAGTRSLARDVPYGKDERQILDIYAPDKAQGPLPVVVFIHGGSWSTGNKNGYEFVGRALAAQGFLVLVANYRLHPQHPFPAFVEDAALTLDWATRHNAEYGGDSHSIFALGHSAGAYNLALAILDKHYLADLGTNVSAIKGVATLAGPFDFLPLDSPITNDVFGNLSNLAETQPVNFARQDAPPFLILHGSADTTVFPKNAYSLDKALSDVGADVKLKIYTGVSHVGIMLSLSKPLRSTAPALADVTDFFRIHMN